MTMKRTPLIKEYRLEKLEACLDCIDKHAFDRERQKDCILSLYLGKSEKSVFRGMVIPSCRHLGLIIGYGDFIRLSANGKIMITSRALGDEVHDRVGRAVLGEVDEVKFGFMDALEANAPISRAAFFSLARTLIDAPTEKQADERIRHWLSMLMQVQLVDRDGGDCLRIRQREFEETLQDLDASSKDVMTFRDHLFDAYRDLTRGRAPVADIPDLREKVAVGMLGLDGGLILTEGQFDQMLAQVAFSSDNYVISLGRPMGAEEKLFEYQGSHFRTLSIRFLKKREVQE